MKACLPGGLLVMASFVVLGCALDAQGTPADGTRVERPQERQQRPRPRPAQQQRAQEEPEGLQIAFDVIPWDHRRTSRYLLEITDSAGAVTVHDLERPRLRGRVIRVPLPDLPPGPYTFVVVAEGPAGTARSSPLKYQVEKK